jgi:cell fate regulator YaaT (PSP1 superfamily)
LSEYIEVKFKGRRTNVYANPQQFPFKVGDFAVVESDKGIDFGKVNLLNPKLKPPRGKNGISFKVLRKALPGDFKNYTQNRINEKQAVALCKSKIEKHKLAMKLVDCEYQFDGNKITFYFTADNRVDFRGLVKDLASEYKTRIDLRQIGVRDESRHQGGYGICGRQLCCSSWIREFSPITTQAAKDQNMPLNPNKLAGVCGRLKCCLIYERDFYNWAIKQYPELAKEIKTEKGRGIVSRIDIFKETIQVKYPDETYETLPLSEIKDKIYKCQNDCGHEHGNLEEIAA